MQEREILLTREADEDISQLACFVASIYQEESGERFRLRMMSQIVELSYSAESFAPSRYLTARRIHPQARTLSIMNHHWTVVFHVEDDYVIIDRILASSMIVN